MNRDPDRDRVDRVLVVLFFGALFFVRIRAALRALQGLRGASKRR